MSTDVLEYELLQKRKAEKEEGGGPGWAVLVTVLAVTLAATVAQLVLAQITHCISLLDLTYQNIYNLLTLATSLVSKAKMGLAPCHGSNPGFGNTFGWRRMEVVGSIGSIVFLFSLCFATFIEALQTIFHNEHLDTIHHQDWILATCGGQVAVWGVAYVAIGGYSHHQASAVRPSVGTQVADIARDLLGVLFTATVCSIVYFKLMVPEYESYIDPIGSMIYIVALVWTCVPLVRDSCLILLQTIPGTVDVSLLKKFILQKFPGILSLHEVHVWSLTPRVMVLTAHITYQNTEVYREIHAQVEGFFSSQGFSQITIQPEFPQDSTLSRQESQSCALACKLACTEKVCCTEEQLSEKGSHHDDHEHHDHDHGHHGDHGDHGHHDDHNGHQGTQEAPQETTTFLD